MSELTGGLDQIPIQWLFLILVSTLTVLVEFTFRLGRWRRGDGGLEKYPLETSANSVVLGLLAFILAFAFGVNASRYAELRDIAREDTDAIKDVYLLSDFLEKNQKQQIRELLYEYHSLRVSAIESRDKKQLGLAIKRSEEIQNALWSRTVEFRLNSDNSVLNQFVAAVNQLMDSHTKRVTKGLVTRLPPIIWITLAALLLLSIGMLGFTSGLHGRRSWLAALIVIFSFSAVLTMIIDLDRPFRSLFQHSGDPSAARLLEQMESDRQQ